MEQLRKKPSKLLLVSSSGGHLKHLTATFDAWQNYERVWVSFKQPDVESALAEEKVYWAYYPTTRNVKNAIRNLFLAFFVAAKLFRAKTLYIECYDRPTLPTMTGKMLYVLADDFNVQSDEQQKNFPDARVIHPIF